MSMECLMTSLRKLLIMKKKMQSILLSKRNNNNNQILEVKELKMKIK